jgi:flagellar biosynthesis/type III secretory pathway chaperone
MEEALRLAELEELLAREQRVLESNDIGALESATRARQERMGALARIEEQRRSLCTLHGYCADRGGLDALISWCDPRGSLLPRLRECADRAVRCRDLNDRNALVVAARLKRVEGMLGVLAGRPAQSDTYGPRGLTHPSARLGRIIGAA